MSLTPPASRSLPRAGLRLLAVHAHPDDESSKGAATMARYAAEGAQVLVVTCTGGERGSILNPAMDRPEVLANLHSVRIAEMARAAEILGVEQRWLGFVDSGFPEGDPLPPIPPDSFAAQPLEVAAAPLVEIFRDFRPHVVLTYDEKGGYPHPDHLKTHEITIEAYEAAGDPERYPGIGGEPWQPLKVYYHVMFPKQRIQALHEAALGLGMKSPYKKWLEDWEDRLEDEARLTTQVEAAEYFPIRNEALLAHATQVDPTGGWFAVPTEVQQKIWPTEDFQLAFSRVKTDLPEDDLFTGVQPESAP